jgi:hypothetical protein
MRRTWSRGATAITTPQADAVTARTELSMQDSSGASARTEGPHPSRIRDGGAHEAEANVSVRSVRMTKTSPAGFASTRLRGRVSTILEAST